MSQFARYPDVISDPIDLRINVRKIRAEDRSEPDRLALLELEARLARIIAMTPLATIIKLKDQKPEARHDRSRDAIGRNHLATPNLEGFPLKLEIKRSLGSRAVSASIGLPKLNLFAVRGVYNKAEIKGLVYGDSHLPGVTINKIDATRYVYQSHTENGYEPRRYTPYKRDFEPHRFMHELAETINYLDRPDTDTDYEIE